MMTVENVRDILKDFGKSKYTDLVVHLLTRDNSLDEYTEEELISSISEIVGND